MPESSVYSNLPRDKCRSRYCSGQGREEGRAIYVATPLRDRDVESPGKDCTETESDLAPCSRARLSRR